MQTISLAALSIVFIPTIALLMVMGRWKLSAWGGLYANVRMLGQLLLVGYFLTFIFGTDQPIVIVGLLAVMVGVSAWIALRPLKAHGVRAYSIVLVSIAVPSLVLLAIVTQLILELPKWFEPRFVLPLAGMIFSNAMNTVSLAAERFDSEIERNVDPENAKTIALEAALIPQLNTLFAVGLVALPGMMTGQILSGVDPLVAVRYQIMVMSMIFGSGGLAAATYLTLTARSVR